MSLMMWFDCVVECVKCGEKKEELVSSGVSLVGCEGMLIYGECEKCGGSVKLYRVNWDVSCDVGGDVEEKGGG